MATQEKNNGFREEYLKLSTDKQPIKKLIFDMLTYADEKQLKVIYQFIKSFLR